MAELKVISLEDFALLDLDPAREIRPSHLVERRGVSIPRLFAGDVFVDERLGYAIAHESVANRISTQKVSEFLVKPGFYPNWTARTARHTRVQEKSRSLQERPWYLSAARPWPDERGAGVTIGLLDYGIQANSRLRDRDKNHGDFCSCSEESAPTEDIGHDLHGTRCAGVISAADLADADDRLIRTSPAPDCRIVAACIARQEEEETISFADILLMLSWAIHAWDARIINLSISIKHTEVEVEGRCDLLGRIAKKLRKNTLIFASAGMDGDYMSYPARVPSIIAIGEYNAYSDKNFNEHVSVVAGTDPSWTFKSELLFGPGSQVESVDVGDGERCFTEASAACAYASGVAALYIQRYFDECSGDLEQILERIMAESIELANSHGKTPWRVIHPPRARAASDR